MVDTAGPIAAAGRSASAGMNGALGELALVDTLPALRLQLSRQVAHWVTAAGRLRELERFASPEAWAGLERYLGEALRRNLLESIDRLQARGAAVQAALASAQNEADLDAVRRRLVVFRGSYLRVETTLDFYADAVNTRTNPYLAALLRACDVLASRSMFQVLDAGGKPTPHVLTYLDKGLGASILRAGLRLWDVATESPVAAIKIVPHNLYRPTALIHEAGHQVSHMVGWHEELAALLARRLAPSGAALADVWASWVPEITADAFAFVHAGYASIAGLHDVLAGDEGYVFRFTPGDPHPVGYLRVLLGVEMCRQCYGAGPWDGLAFAWIRAHPLAAAPPGIANLLGRSLPLLPQVAELSLRAPLRAFGGKSLCGLVDPDRVRPDVLLRLKAQVGPALYTSPHWLFTEGLRLLALTGYRSATLPEQAAEALSEQEGWMLRLGKAQTA